MLLLLLCSAQRGAEVYDIMASSVNCRCPDIKSIYKHEIFIAGTVGLFSQFDAAPLLLFKNSRLDPAGSLSGSSLAFTVLGGSAGGVADDVREARPPDHGGAGGDDEEALQGFGVTGHVGAAA